MVVVWRGLGRVWGGLVVAQRDLGGLRWSVMVCDGLVVVRAGMGRSGGMPGGHRVRGAVRVVCRRARMACAQCLR